MVFNAVEALDEHDWVFSARCQRMSRKCLCEALFHARKEDQLGQTGIVTLLRPIGDREGVCSKELNAWCMEVNVSSWCEEWLGSASIDVDGDTQHLFRIIRSALHHFDLSTHAIQGRSEGGEVGHANEASKHVKAPEGAGDNDTVGKVGEVRFIEERNVVPQTDENGDGDDDVQCDKDLFVMIELAFQMLNPRLVCKGTHLIGPVSQWTGAEDDLQNDEHGRSKAHARIQ